MNEPFSPTPPDQPPKETNDQRSRRPRAKEGLDAGPVAAGHRGPVCHQPVRADRVDLPDPRAIAAAGGDGRAAAHHDRKRQSPVVAECRCWKIPRAFDEKGIHLDSLEFNIVNPGTGPAIIERASVQYEGKYAKSWGELFRLTNYPDSLSAVRDDALISGRVLPANTGSTFLGLSDNQPLMEHMNRIIDNEGFTITICYRSVFNDYWLREQKFGRDGFDRLNPVDSCVIADSVAFHD